MGRLFVVYWLVVNGTLCALRIGWLVVTFRVFCYVLFAWILCCVVLIVACCEVCVWGLVWVWMWVVLGVLANLVLILVGGVFELLSLVLCGLRLMLALVVQLGCGG